MPAYRKQLYDKNGNKLYPVVDILDIIYPIGSIYLSATISTAEALSAILGGTWESWGSGRVPVGVDTTQTEFDTAEETGGEKTHTLTINEMPSHRHDIGYRIGGGAGSTWYVDPGSPESRASEDYGCIGLKGGGQAHNNLPPYITCYMYKRTA